MQNSKTISPARWVPTAYFYQAIPNTVMQSLLVYFYLAMNVHPEVSSVTISLLYLPWFIKPLWGPIVDILKTKKWWAITTQAIVGVAFLCAGLLVSSENFFFYTLLAFVVIALSAATYDVASDGMYMIHLNSNQQSVWVGLRSTAFRVGWLLVDGGLLWLLGILLTFYADSGDNAMVSVAAWQMIFFVLAAITAVMLIYNYITFPQDSPKTNTKTVGGIVKEFGQTITTFFAKPHIVWGVLFLVMYRAGEAQLLQILPAFLSDSVAQGGLAIPLDMQGIIKGVVGVVTLICGGILGGIVISRKGLRFWVIPMILILNIPNIGYVLLSFFPEQVHAMGAAGLALVGIIVGLGYFGYGFSFTSYTMYMVYISRGTFATSHYAICSGLMALSLIWPKFISGFTVSWLGYPSFFIMVIVLGLLPSLYLSRRLHIDKGFGVSD